MFDAPHQFTFFWLIRYNSKSSAAQIGTAYLLSPQASTSAVHRAALKAGRDDTTRLTNLFTGRPARGHLNRYLREQGPMNAAAPAFPLATGAITPLRNHAEKTGSGEFSPLWSGEAAPLAREEDAGEFTRRVWKDASARIATIARRTCD